MTRYSIDQEAGTISFVLDEDTGEKQTEGIEDLIAVLMWLKRRERDVRRLIFETFPPDDYGYQRMHQANTFYIGCAIDRTKSMGGQKDQVKLCPVKVRAEHFQRELQGIERGAKTVWAARINERKATGYIPIWDASGKVLNEDTRKPVEEDDTPPWFYQEEQARVWTPEYWQYREENLDRGKPARYP